MRKFLQESGVVCGSRDRLSSRSTCARLSLPRAVPAAGSSQVIQRKAIAKSGSGDLAAVDEQARLFVVGPIDGVYNGPDRIVRNQKYLETHVLGTTCAC